MQHHVAFTFGLKRRIMARNDHDYIFLTYQPISAERINEQPIIKIDNKTNQTSLLTIYVKQRDLSKAMYLDELIQSELLLVESIKEESCSLGESAFSKDTYLPVSLTNRPLAKQRSTYFLEELSARFCDKLMAWCYSLPVTDEEVKARVVNFHLYWEDTKCLDTIDVTQTKFYQTEKIS